jgi:fucose 4-O-acetylase-like acetyltransferase
MEKRDHSLDVLKGVACILMIFSHAAIETKNPVILGLGFFGSFAAALFFSVTGITAWMQASRRSPKEILPPYLILLLAGFSLNGIIQIDFYRTFEVEMLQMIALGAALVYLTHHFFHLRPIFYFILGIVPYLIKILVDLLTKDVLTSQVIDLSGLQGWFIPPGTFTPIPWLFVFFMGVFAYQVSAKTNLYFASLSIFAVLGILLATRNPASLDLVNKWDMSAGYFLFSCFCLFFSFYLTKRFPINETKPIWRYFLFLGKNSLLFLYVHILVINVLYRLGAARLTWFYWPLILAITSGMIYGILAFYPGTNLSRLFQSKGTWLVLVALVMLTPLVIKEKTWIFGLEFLWGVLLSTNYPVLRGVFRDQSMPPPGLDKVNGV